MSTSGEEGSSGAAESSRPKIDSEVPQTARVWNYWLGGKDNYPVDRALGDEIAEAFPIIVEIARADRAVLNRVVRYLAGEAGVRQFLDVGTGLPTANNTHEVAQAVAPQARIVYVDYDPLVLVHARALLTSGPEGATDYIDADIRDTETILREAGRTLDLSQPVAVILSGILAHLPSVEEARAVVRRLMDALPAGSYLVAVDGADTNPELNDVMNIWNQSANPPYAMRTPEEIASYFEGLELVEPGLVDVTRWRPEPSPAGPPRPLDNLVGVGRKP
ncbi:S-adenosyl methyltransferase [Plantactinospora sp. BC1]|uniref:SAM-dependent methyltransferase n=1 Tax=Plantactinospora sp. BC1 TaxID=2108470 RepID=UPI000D1737F5|nr:SAM-dependent methyltransferase [Plantactinospora sp. BC1]AVT34684.1 S-adenosyl methyltransferase [Plantactinospora sp. BC1]